MWIRSQDRETITNARNVRVTKPDENGKWQIVERLNPKEDLILGDYSTEENCIEVLDLIARAIEEDNSEHFIFQMPREEVD